jgi:hypothetical protein
MHILVASDGHLDPEKATGLIFGSHGRGRFEGPLGSTVTKLMRRAPMPVLVIQRGPHAAERSGSAE